MLVHNTNNLNWYFTYPLRVILLLIMKINLTLGQSNEQEDQGNLKRIPPNYAQQNV